MKLTLEKALRKVFLLSQIFGLVPLKLGTKGFSVSPLFMVLSLGFVVLITIWTILNTFRASFYISLPFIQFIVKIIRIIFVSYLISCIATSLNCVRKMNHVIDDLWCIDIFLSQIGAVVEDAISICFSTVCIFIHLVLFAIQMSISEQLHLDIGNIYIFFLITHASESQYIGLLDIFLNRFQALVECLKKVKCRNDCTYTAVVLSNVHLLLSESVSKISKIYSPQLFFFTSLSLARFIVFLFSIVFLRSTAVADIQLLIYLIFPYWLFISTSTFLRVIRMIVLVTKKADEFNTLLYQIMLEDKDNELLSNQKLYLHIAMKREVVFTACGFFRLDYTLVHSMIAATTTYLVILIQFGQMPTLPIPSPTTANTTEPFFNATTMII